MSKKRKRLIMVKIIIYFVLINVFISLVLSFIFFSGVFSIKDIQVKNNTKVDSEIIVTQSQIKTGENIFLLKNHIVRENLKKVPYIEDVSINRVLPNKIEVFVKERTPQFVVKSNENYYLIDSEGIILEKIDNVENNTLLVIVLASEIQDEMVGKSLNEKDLLKIKNVETVLQVADSNGIRDLITKFDLTNEQDIVIEIASELKYAHLGSFDDDTGLNMKFFWLKSMLEQEKGKSGVIYLNVDLTKNKVVFSEQSF